jgi:HlyD family secretion protein
MNALSSPPSRPNRVVRAFRIQPRSTLHAGKRLMFSVAPVLLLISGGALFVFPAVERLRGNLITHRVQFQNLQLALNESGFLQSASNTDIVCRVKARTRGSTVASTMKWVIEDGTRVQPGDVVAELDDSGLQEDCRSQRMAVTRARSDWAQAEENRAIVASQCEGDVQSARINLELAQLDLKKYVRADYEQARQDVLGRLFTAEADAEMWRDRVAWSGRMLKKGYLTSNQVVAANASLANSRIALDNVREELRVLEQFTKRRCVTDLQSKVAEARRALERVKSQALAKELQAQVDLLAKKSVCEIEEARLRDIEEEIKHCTIFAPQAGMVVYYTSEQSRYGSGAQQGVIAQGEPVREGQRLMQVPDLSQMIVETQIHEAMLAHVHGGERVVIHVHAFPDKVLHGHVKYVSVIPSLREWVWADIKVYPAKIAIDGLPAGLKPGMTADVVIQAERPLEHVLAVPVEAVLAPSKRGEPSKCYVLTPDGPQPREIAIGLSDATMVEVKSGLQEGEEVVLNPATLLAERKEEASR